MKGVLGADWTVAVEGKMGRTYVDLKNIIEECEKVRN